MGNKAHSKSMHGLSLPFDPGYMAQLAYLICKSERWTCERTQISQSLSKNHVQFEHVRHTVCISSRLPFWMAYGIPVSFIDYGAAGLSQPPSCNNYNYYSVALVVWRASDLKTGASLWSGWDLLHRCSSLLQSQSRPSSIRWKHTRGLALCCLRCECVHFGGHRKHLHKVKKTQRVRKLRHQANGWPVELLDKLSCQNTGNKWWSMRLLSHTKGDFIWKLNVQLTRNKRATGAKKTRGWENKQDAIGLT